jgi:hypothetical protein
MYNFAIPETKFRNYNCKSFLFAQLFSENRKTVAPKIISLKKYVASFRK